MNKGPTWAGEGLAVPSLRIGPVGWVRLVLRGSMLAIVTFGGLAILLSVRLAERPIHRLNRPWTPYIAQFACRTGLRILGIDYAAHGVRMGQPGAVVANHSSWLDIFALNAAARVYFVAKAEVARWPAIGWLARATGTVFIRRETRDAAEQRQVFEDRLQAGHKLLFFPEGTSTDGLRVLRFKATLFAAFFSDSLRELLWVQPVSVIYRAPQGEAARFYGWWGDMDFATHLFAILAVRNPGAVNLTYHAPLRVADYSNRKALALACENAVRAGLPAPGSKPS